MKKKIMTVVPLLIGLTSCVNVNSFSFGEVVNFSIEEVDYVQCHLSVKMSAVFGSSDQQFILDAIDTKYTDVTSIIYNENDDFDLGFYLYNEKNLLSSVYLINRFFYVESNDSFYKSVKPVSKEDIFHIEESIIR